MPTSFVNDFLLSLSRFSCLVPSLLSVVPPSDPPPPEATFLCVFVVSETVIKILLLSGDPAVAITIYLLFFLSASRCSFSFNAVIAANIYVSSDSVNPKISIYDIPSFSKETTNVQWEYTTLSASETGIPPRNLRILFL